MRSSKLKEHFKDPLSVKYKAHSFASLLVGKKCVGVSLSSKPSASLRFLAGLLRVPAVPGLVPGEPGDLAGDPFFGDSILRGERDIELSLIVGAEKLCFRHRR